MAYLTSHEIIETYDTNPNMTLKELSRLSGWTVPSLKRLLMAPATETGAVAAYVAEGLGEY